jgi:hypothetical protein
MNPEDKVYVRMVEGTNFRAPAPARKDPDGTFQLLDNEEFDPEDTSTLLEFLPGDVVRATTQTFNEDLGPRLVATDLVRSSLEDGDYWRVLFYVIMDESVPALSGDKLRDIEARVRRESETGTRWHYPRVIEWAKSVP